MARIRASGGEQLSAGESPLEQDGALPAPLDVDAAWALLLFLASKARAGHAVRGPVSVGRVAGHWQEVPPSRARLWVDAEVPGFVRGEPSFCPAGRSMLELFLPLLLGPRAARLVVGHLGQSLDGRVATPTGVSQFITGREDVVHTHRLRALFDAVLVGVRTVELDDPQLTTRLVPGEHPTRVVLDPHGKLASGYKVLEDAVAPTLVCTLDSALPRDKKRGHVEWLPVPSSDGSFHVRALLEVLAARGLSRVFVEGGGVTISRFITARVLDRLHVSVAPMILGSGAPAFALPPIDRLEEALTPRCRHFSLGRDILFDCELQTAPVASAE
jgi:diaminohydroxyphosphoribosylaminopyrimidine deaminase/5-amino-6-(5-phosphoribosylamino)uracil reductase